MNSTELVQGALLISTLWLFAGGHWICGIIAAFFVLVFDHKGTPK